MSEPGKAHNIYLADDLWTALDTLAIHRRQSTSSFISSLLWDLLRAEIGEPGFPRHLLQAVRLPERPAVDYLVRAPRRPMRMADYVWPDNLPAQQAQCKHVWARRRPRIADCRLCGLTGVRKDHVEVDSDIPEDTGVRERRNTYWMKKLLASVQKP